MLVERHKNGRGIRPGGFTLIELLVVISIISMMMSITLPSLNRAKEAGKRVVCLSNLRQLTLGWNFYANDYEDRLCSPDTYWNDIGGSGYWVADGPGLPTNNVGGTERAIKNGILWAYTEETLDLYRCKSDSSRLLRSYSIANTMGGRVRDGIWPYHTLSEVSRPAEKMVFVDAGTRWKWISGGFWPIDVDGGDLKWRLRSGHNITARHGGGCNMSFADFHCEFRKWRDWRTEKLAYWEIKPEDATYNNSDLEHIAKLLKGR
jgi:prepilin-type N-terminal cleavage/methylation domain-containing protein/prepilin-type processing-associated H-X9-DG protein